VAVSTTISPTRPGVDPRGHSGTSDTSDELPSFSQWRSLSHPTAPPRPRTPLENLWHSVHGRADRLVPRRGPLLRHARRIADIARPLYEQPEQRLRDEVHELQARFRTGRDTRADLHRAMAVISAAGKHAFGFHAHPEQIACAMALCHGAIAELATGEGKTLAAGFAACVAGWRGRGCHVVTVNDYLATRDAETMAPLYQLCGLSVASIDGDMQPPERRAAYLADVTYVTNKDVAADFLRDRLTLASNRGLCDALVDRWTTGRAAVWQSLVQRGLNVAIIDEADSVLIDEAVTPLIISGSASDKADEQQVRAFHLARELADGLERDTHYRVNLKHREVELTERGRDAVYQAYADAPERFPGLLCGQNRREEMVTQALTATYLFLRGQQYVVLEFKVCIVDESTGRLMPDRTWRAGLHQAVEAKEGLEVQPLKDTMARVSFQRFFRMYQHMAGTTGTALEARQEFWEIYNLPVIPIPPHRPVIRKQRKDQIALDSSTRWDAVVDDVVEQHAQGRAVLVGTRSVGASQTLSEALAARGLEHEVLNAVNHEHEAQIVEQAGQPGRITVATNMAGRGTDIKLHERVRGLGGLHVIATERHESPRVDRQLFGRSGRQGDPGSVSVIISVEDELFTRYAPRMTRLLRWLGAGVVPQRLARLVRGHAQHRAKTLAFQQRRSVHKQDDWLEEHLSFRGRGW